MADSRHCAYCLKLCAAAKLCGGCKRRAYCSKECQRVDWKVGSGKKGQGHKNWCAARECGEEDVDWVIAPVPGKGLGMVAKRFLPALYRIVVEPVWADPHAHPGVQDLMPETGSLEDKFHLNFIRGVGGKLNGVLALRIARANHSCDPNADHIYDDGAEVLVLYAQRDIQAGEEICISYIAFNDLDTQRAAYTRETLQSKWGIVCPDDCVCRNQHLDSLLDRARRLSIEIEQLASCRMLDDALVAIEQLLILEEHARSSLLDRAKTRHYAYQVAMARPETRRQAELHLIAVCNFHTAVQPYAKFTRSVQSTLKSLVRC